MSEIERLYKEYEEKVKEIQRTCQHKDREWTMQSVSSGLMGASFNPFPDMILRCTWCGKTLSEPVPFGFILHVLFNSKDREDANRILTEKFKLHEDLSAKMIS